MKSKTANLKRIDILGNGDRSSDQEILAAILKQWRQKLGYCSIFAVVPAMLVSQVQGARTDEAKKPEVSVAGRTTRLLERLNKSCSNPALLKRQSKFLLPHQKGSFDMQAALGGNDDCPGRAIPGGSYTAAAPYIESGDTTGANDTVTRVVYYYGYDAVGPDHVYSFTLTGRGPNPQIQVSTTSGTYRPLIYVLQGGSAGVCPAGTGNTAFNGLTVSDSRWTSGSTATLNANQMNYLPLNVPLHLFVDSARNDASGSGPYTIRMQDVTIAPAPITNQIDDAQFFVQQHYRDFLNREPDVAGLTFWTNEIASCGNNAQCIEAKRINVSAAYFLSIEFQQTGYEVYRLYKTAFGNIPDAPVPVRLGEFLADTPRIGRGVIVNQSSWEQVLENNKQAFASDFVQWSRFTNTFPPSTSAAEFVDKLNSNAGSPLSQSERDQLVNDLATGRKTRVQVLRAIAEDPDFVSAEFNRAFVLMQYFGYLRRNPNDAPNANFDGYNFWLNKLNQFNGDFVQAEMVKAFINSTEYRQRFGP